MTNVITAEYLDEILEAFNGKDPDLIASYFAEDGVFQAPLGPAPHGNRAVGKQQIKDFLVQRWKDFPDMCWKDQVSWISGDKAASTWKITWTGKDGVLNEWAGCDLYVFEGNQIKLKDTYWKRPLM